MKRAAVLVSGGGTNLQALIDAEKAGKLTAGTIALVVSGRDDAYALERAKSNGIPSVVLRRRDYVSTEAYDQALCAVLEEHRVDLVVLAGFLSIIGPAVLAAFPKRVINIHPSLLPAFGGKGCYGLKVHEAALRRGVKITGATVHYVDGEVDGGEIIAQKAVAVREGDTAETLQRRVMEEAEWQLLPAAVEMLYKEDAEGRGPPAPPGYEYRAALQNILVIGGGGREHAIIQKLRGNLYAMPGNGGIAREARCLPGKAADTKAVLSYIKEHRIDFVIVSPDDPLVQGMADAIRAAGVRTFGPSAAAALIEGSKVFSKNLMKKYRIPTARYEVFDNSAEALAYIRAENTFPTVIKADGLALGKGVVIAANMGEAEEAVRSIMEEKIFGSSGGRIVVEEYLEGPEVTVLAFTDSKTIVPMVSSMDHKRAFDGNQGPNTGGMGVIAPNPYYTPAIAETCMKDIFLPTVEAMNREGRPFKGCLYFGLMLTASGPKVIEYNCRFGDPEAQAVLPLLETDLLSILLAVEEERLSDITVRFRDAASCCVVLASGGYPGKYPTGFKIAEKAALSPDASCFWAGAEQKDGALYTSGGRVLGVTALGPTLEEAVKKAYREAEKFSFEGMFYRRDIGGDRNASF